MDSNEYLIQESRMKEIVNSPSVKIGLVGASRPYFSISLAARRLAALMKALERTTLNVHQCSVMVQNETDVLTALRELSGEGCNAAVIYLGNFGPEGPASLFAKRFNGPTMYCGAAEEDKEALAKDRGDALCGLLNTSYNLNLRRARAYIPPMPIGLPEELATEIESFADVARVVIGVRNLKVIAFGPRPHDFFACYAPLQPLMDLGVEVMENSELDLYQAYKKAASRTAEIDTCLRDMKKELGENHGCAELLPRMAQLEVALLDFFEQNLAPDQFGVFANKCWPAFEAEFGFLPCYVNSRLSGRGIPAACEVDLYGAVSQYMMQLAGPCAATLLDINNSVPHDLLPEGTDLKGAEPGDLFMGFHCGNTYSGCMKSSSLNPPGKLEGRIKPGPVTIFRLQSSPDGKLETYVAEGEILDVPPNTYGSSGIVAIPHFARFYRHVLIGKSFPHHAAVGFEKLGKTLFEASGLLGLKEINVPLPPSSSYDRENPFSLHR